MNVDNSNPPSTEDLLTTIRELVNQNRELKLRLAPIKSGKQGRPRSNEISRPDYYCPKYGIWVSKVVDIMIDEYGRYRKSHSNDDFPATRLFKPERFRVSLQTLHLWTKFGLKYLFENDMGSETSRPYTDYLEYSRNFYSKWRKDCISLEFTDLSIANAGALSNPVPCVEREDGKPNNNVGVVGEENLSWQEEVDRFVANTDDDIQIRLNNVNLSDEDVSELAAMFNGIKDGFNMIVKNVSRNEIFVIKSKKIYEILSKGTNQV